MKKIFILAAALLLLACENREEPVQFKIEAEQAYSFSETANTASFAITGNIPWEVALKSGNDWCRITPTAAKGDGKVEIFVTANTAYLQERTATMVIKAGAFSREIAVTQAPPPCPAFDAGSIATAGQTIWIGETPAAIQNVQEATGGGTVAYQWYKNGNPISNATAATYTPPATDAAVAGVHTYTRHAKDNVCNTTFTQSAGSWVLTVMTCNFSAGAISSAGQTIVAGGTPAAINSVQDAASDYGIILYQWYKNGVAITGAMDRTYTPPPADAMAVGAYTYTRQARDTLCYKNFTQSAGSWVLTVTSCTFSAGTIATAGQTICSGNAVNTITSSANASGGDGNVTYQWRRNGATISGAIAAYYTPTAYNTTAGAHTFTRWAKDNACNTAFVQSAGQYVLTVRPAFSPGAITTASGTTSPGTNPNITIASLTEASGGDNTVTYQWRRTGTSSATFSYNYPAYPISNSTTNYATAGTYTFMRYAHDNTCNTAWVASTGQYTLTVAASTTPGPGTNTPPSAGTKTYTVCSQTWSEPIRIAACDHDDFTNSYTTPTCRSYSWDGIKYYYYNWPYVNTYGSSTMCPSPWRVPSSGDFQSLMNCLGDSPSLNVYYPETSVWAGMLAGYAEGSFVNNILLHGLYWSADIYAPDFATCFGFLPYYAFMYSHNMFTGLQVRCVR